jgi:hypothetical protein
MAKCLFCLNRADSLEHVLPGWLLRCVEPKTKGHFPVHVAHYVEGQGYKEKRHHVSVQFKARIVCRACNNGWMSRLEREVEPLLRQLIQLDFPVLAQSFMEGLRKDAKLLAFWLSKTAMTTSFALPGRQHLPGCLCAEISKGKAIEGVWVDVAKAESPAFAAALTRTFATTNGGVYVGAQKHQRHESFQFCLQANHLLLRIAMASEAEARYKPPMPFRIFPTAHQQVPEELCFPDINKFFQALALNTWLGCEGESPVESKIARPW